MLYPSLLYSTIATIRQKHITFSCGRNIEHCPDGATYSEFLAKVQEAIGAYNSFLVACCSDPPYNLMEDSVEVCQSEAEIKAVIEDLKNRVNGLQRSIKSNGSGQSGLKTVAQGNYYVIQAAFQSMKFPGYTNWRVYESGWYDNSGSIDPISGSPIGPLPPCNPGDKYPTFTYTMTVWCNG